MTEVSGIGGFVNVGPPPIVGSGAPSATLPAQTGQLYFDNTTTPRNTYVFTGIAWELLAESSGTNFTLNGSLFGLGGSGIGSTAAGTTGQVLTATTGSAPSFQAPGVGSGLTAHGVLMGEGASAIAASSAGTSGQVFTSGGASADGAYQNVGVNSNLTGLIVGNTNSAFTTTTYTPATAFTPAFSLATPGDSAWTYTSRIGRYNQVGAVVYFTAQLVWSNFTNSTGAGNWQINIPVVSGAFAQTGQIYISGSGIDASAQTANLPSNFLGVVGNAQSICVLSVNEGGVGNAASALFSLTVTQVKTAGTLNISGFYFAA